MCSYIDWYSSMKQKIEKDSDNFWCKKLTFKVGRLGDFALFDTSPLVQFSKFKNFHWVCWFLGKNLSNFVPPVWKLHNPYCHILYKPCPNLVGLPLIDNTQIVLLIEIDKVYLTTFWIPKKFFQWAFFLTFWPDVWLVFKSG